MEESIKILKGISDSLAALVQIISSDYSSVRKKIEAIDELYATASKNELGGKRPIVVFVDRDNFEAFCGVVNDRATIILSKVVDRILSMSKTPVTEDEADKIKFEYQNSGRSGV